MDIADVTTLDEALKLKSCDRWMGCLLCPDPGPGGEEDIEIMVNLLEMGKRVFFHKRPKKW